MPGVTAALLGLTHPHSPGHLRTLQMLPEIDRLLLWDADATVVDAQRSNPGDKVALVTTNLDTVLTDPALLFVIAAVRNDLGPALFCQVLEAGKHLLAEKPIGRSAADTQHVIHVAQRTGQKLGVCYQNRYGPWVQDARHFVQQGLIGDLISVEMRLITTQVKFRNPASWLFSHQYAGGGMLSWLGCHSIDLMRYITGESIAAVSAEVATRSGEAIDVEDIASLVLRFQSGALGSLHVGYVLALSGSGYFNKSGYDIYTGINGRLGRIHWSSNTLAPASIAVETTHPTWASAPQRTFHYTLAESSAYAGAYGEQFVRDFMRAAQGEAIPLPTTGEDALHVARVVDAAYESSRLGRRVELP